MEFVYQHTTIKKPDEKAMEESRARLAPTLARNVQRLRKQARYTKKAFALMVGIGRPFLDRIEAGTVDVRMSILVRLADALETTPERLLSDRDEESAPLADSKSASMVEVCGVHGAAHRPSDYPAGTSPAAYRIPETQKAQTVPVWNPWNY